MGRSLLPLWCGALGVGARLLRGRDQARRVGLEAVDALPGRLQFLAEPLVSNLWFQTLGRSALECRGWHRDRRADLRRLTSFSRHLACTSCCGIGRSASGTRAVHGRRDVRTTRRVSADRVRLATPLRATSHSRREPGGGALGGFRFGASLIARCSAAVLVPGGRRVECHERRVTLFGGRVTLFGGRVTLFGGAALVTDRTVAGVWRPRMGAFSNPQRGTVCSDYGVLLRDDLTLDIAQLLSHGWVRVGFYEHGVESSDRGTHRNRKVSHLAGGGWMQDRHWPSAAGSVLDAARPRRDPSRSVALVTASTQEVGADVRSRVVRDRVPARGEPQALARS